MSLPPLIPAGSLSTKVVVHDRIALHKPSFKNFSSADLAHEHHIGVAAPRGVERLTVPCATTFVDAGLLLEQRQDVAEQAGIHVGSSATTMDCPGQRGE